MKGRNDFSVFILSHRRARSLSTYNTLRRHGYTGNIRIIIDDQDPERQLYTESFGSEVHIFDKEKAAAYTDSGDNLTKRNSVVYARNECFTIAKELGFKYFLVLDDDYTAISYRYNPEGQFVHHNIRFLDDLIGATLEYYTSIPALSIAWAQSGDFIGGDGNTFPSSNRTRKVMNSFFCCTDRPFKFMGRINEDVNAYTSLGHRGHLFLTIPIISINQRDTQQAVGGLTDIYLDIGTYVKSFYSILYMPASIKIYHMGDKFMRIHHRINWKKTVPMIIPEKYRKK